MSVNEYTLLGYIDDKLGLSTTLRTNSVKQAQERFTRKYEPILKGSWTISILLNDSEVDGFQINKNVKRELPNYWCNIKLGLNRGFGNIFDIDDSPLHKVGDNYACHYLRSGWSVQHLSRPVDKNKAWEDS